jgi:alkaline phosphatase
MKNVTKITCLIVLFLGTHVVAQPKSYSTENAHAHNDYLNKNPFYAAYKSGFASIEVDVFPVNGTLMVAHSKKEISPANTLKKLYLDPLARELALNPERKLKLLIDIKENYKESLDILMREIFPIVRYLSTKYSSRPLTVLITGNRPPPSQYGSYPPNFFFDDDLKLVHNPEEWERVGQVSLAFGRYSSWKGIGKPAKQDVKKLRHVIDSVHQAGKTIRFWAAPDNATSWKLQKKLGVDLIGTDKVEELGAFLK